MADENGTATPQNNNSGEAGTKEDSTDKGDGGGLLTNENSEPDKPGETKPAEGENKEGDKGGEKKDGNLLTGDNKPAVDTSYTLTPTKDGLLDKDAVANLEAYAKEQGLDKKAAESLLKREEGLAKANDEQLAKQHDSLVNEWAEKTKADKEIGGQDFKKNLAYAQNALKKFGTPELNKELDISGHSNHPEIIRLLMKVGKAMQGDSFIQGRATSTGKKSAASILFDNTKKQE